MFHREHTTVTNFRADYANWSDFCLVLETNLKPFYLLTFLLTSNHKDAEQCLGAIIEESFTEDRVFKAWVVSWIKRCLIRKAIQIVFSRTDNEEPRNLWCKELGEPQLRSMVDAITALEAAERFVYVMSILEGYSNKECSLLLDSTMDNIVRVRARASRRLSASEPFRAENLAGLIDRRESA